MTHSVGLPCQRLLQTSSRAATGEQYHCDQGVPATMVSAASPIHFLSLILLPSPWCCVSHPAAFKQIYVLFKLTSVSFPGLQQRTHCLLQWCLKCGKDHRPSAPWSKSWAKAESLRFLSKVMLPSECNHCSNYALSFWKHLLTYHWVLMGMNASLWDTKYSEVHSCQE